MNNISIKLLTVEVKMLKSNYIRALKEAYKENDRLLDKIKMLELELENINFKQNITQSNTIPDQIVSLADICKTLKISRATLWRWQKSGNFPKAMQIGPNKVGFFQLDVDAWLESKHSKN